MWSERAHPADQQPQVPVREHLLATDHVSIPGIQPGADHGVTLSQLRAGQRMPRVLSDAMVSSSPDTHLTLAITPVHAAGCTRTGLDLQQAEAGAVGVEVRIDQAGDDRTAAAVNDPVARPGALRDLGDRTRGDPDASFPQRGDFFFDAAWCSFWAPFHLGIAAADPLSALLWAPSVRAEPGASTTPLPVTTATSCTSASPIWDGTYGPGTRLISPLRPGASPRSSSAARCL